MQISSNTTGMQAGLTVATDKVGKDYCVIVVKGTFDIPDDAHQAVTLAEQQVGLVYADEHYGDPGETSIKYECDFARFKPKSDIILNATAYAPGGAPVSEMEVSVTVNGTEKKLVVIGDRIWQDGVLGPKPSKPKPFESMPIIYERSFGGSDHTHDHQMHQGSELRNLVGIGYHKNRDPKAARGSALPNIELPGNRIASFTDTPSPAGFGILGRGWQPRVRYAGTYDESWLRNQRPFLPSDFDDQYFQSAPEDQQFDHFRGGEWVQCTGLTPSGRLEFAIPQLHLPVTCVFRDRVEHATCVQDTAIIEPDLRRCIVVSRAVIPIGPRLHALREVFVGPQPKVRTSGKQSYGSLSEMIAAKHGQGG
ncbi:hypothetical protein Mal15_25130 [Stieleria maiorica]|uniref:DUF2169 domain-containing protein n=1 Tax=Stieleria maiorica TaxID=2795974 RepID=A0A5B9MAZ5_9BACT|nr:DUF2169 domain-containing protein [Stieleria maiorica]QEF98461.1 hypothetical protein Mal15_25130 [Stieleria maiorica]